MFSVFADFSSFSLRNNYLHRWHIAFAVNVFFRVQSSVLYIWEITKFLAVVTLALFIFLDGHKIFIFLFHFCWKIFNSMQCCHYNHTSIKKRKQTWFNMNAPLPSKPIGLLPLLAVIAKMCGCNILFVWSLTHCPSWNRLPCNHQQYSIIATCHNHLILLLVSREENRSRNKLRTPRGLRSQKGFRPCTPLQHKNVTIHSLIYLSKANW